MNSQFKWLLYLICGVTDFSAFIVIFAVSRGLAEGKAESWYLGLVGGTTGTQYFVASPIRFCTLPPCVLID